MGKEIKSGIQICAFLVCLVFLLGLCGCNTVIGATEGAKKDYKEAQKMDGWMQKNMW